MAAVNVIRQEHGDGWSIYNADSCDAIKSLPDRSVHCSIYSPPFVGLYIYSASVCDMGNSDDDEFWKHYDYLVREMLRVTVTGRLSIVHCKDLPLYKGRDGAAGLIDFPGKIIALHERTGWTYHSRVTIWKYPVIERERTNNHGLLHKTIVRDSSAVRQGMADYLVVFRKNGETLLSDEPVARPGGLTQYVGDSDPRSESFHPSPYARTNQDYRDSVVIWRRYAEPVWWDVQQTNVLNYKDGRANDDDRHICPLQLDVIERCIDLWSNPGDVILTPFLGVGSEVYQAIKQGRKGVGIELKESYFDQAVTNCRTAQKERDLASAGMFAETQ